MRREPFSGESTESRRSTRGRIARKIKGPEPLASLDDPLTTMQFRAFDWIMRNEAKLVSKRAQVQAMRKRSDLEIFAKFPLHVVPTYPGDETVFSSALFRLLRSELPSMDRKLDDIIRT